MVENAIQIDNRTGNAVLCVLRYYALFKYPLTVEEITANSSVPCTKMDVQMELNEMILTGIVFSNNGFYSTETNIVHLAEKRQIANKLAEKKIRLATKTGLLIAAFPFVRFVGISGSLSKGCADAKSDFDYFIITSENRLWVCRSVLHVFKKLTFAFRQQHKFCMNYFIDVSGLLIEEQNIFTATELCSLIPVAGRKYYDDLIKENQHWVKSMFPNGYQKFYAPEKILDGNNILKKLAETLMNPFASKLNVWLMQFTDKRWRKKWCKRNYPQSAYDLAFKTTLHHSKNHPANHQKKVLNALSR